uniref:uncharacterized protein LOC122578048 n=1 Tax=Erigeron canadensis TaxID=72917 RepID=UPI001CB913C8|nr:uncharacterized protein LOC122578048 [Erigeron canadensis]
MEISLSKTKSLDLKTFYNSEVISNNGNTTSNTTSSSSSSWLGNGGGEATKTKKRKNRKEEVGGDNPGDVKKIRQISDGTCMSGFGIGQKILNGYNAANGVIPKRPRGSFGRSKFAKSRLLKSSEKVDKLKDEVKVASDEPLDPKVASSSKEIGKLNGVSMGKVRTKQKGVVYKGNQKQESSAKSDDDGDLGKMIGTKDADAVNQNIVPDAVDTLQSSSSSDEVAKLKYEFRERTPIKDVPLNSISTSADQMGKLIGNSKGKLRNNVKQNGMDGTQKQKEVSAAVGSSRLAKGQGTGLVFNNKDFSTKQNGNNRSKRKMLGSGTETIAKKVESSVEKKCSALDIDPDDDLEQNAARMLSSRFDPSCTGFALKDKSLALSSANGDSEGPMVASDPVTTDTADRVLRPRRHQKGKGTTSRKRRRFYEIHSDDMDAHWFLKRKIKIFWPLDDSWYYGLVNDYDAERNLHHIKYNDWDEEWISLDKERFKLLLLSSEVPRRVSSKDTPSEDTHKEDSDGNRGIRHAHIKDDGFMATHMESEPIISWLACSSHRVKSHTSTSLKKPKFTHSPSDNSIDVYDTGKMGLLERETDMPTCSSAFINASADSGENLPIVYVRRRYRRCSDASPRLLNDVQLELDSALVDSREYKICISLWPILTFVLGVDMLWLLHSIYLMHYGTMITIWPTVFMEVLFVDNIVGLRLFLYKGCLKQAVSFIFLALKVFCEPEKDEYINRQFPMTSIRLKLSFFQNFRKQKVFTYHSFSKVRDVDWQHIDAEFQPHCSLSKRLSLSECTYDNIKLLDAETQNSHMPYAGQSVSYEVLHKKSNSGPLPSLSSYRSSSSIVPGSRASTIFSLKRGTLPPFALSFSAAPNFFLGLHLKLLLERSISLQDHADDCSYVEDQFEISTESSSGSHDAEMSSVDAKGSGMVCTNSHHGNGAAIITIDGGLRQSAELVLDANYNVSQTSIASEAVQTVVNSDKYQGTNRLSQQFGFSEDPAGSSHLKGISVEIPTSDEVYRDFQRTPGTQQVSPLTWNFSDGIICSTTPTHDNSSPFGDSLHSSADGKSYVIGSGFGNGPKKPRTQVQYTLPSRELDFKIKTYNQSSHLYQRIRKSNDKKTSDVSKAPRRNLELVACDVNILINGGDKGWRECGARVFLEAADQNDWKLAVKSSGKLKYAYKVHQDLQSGSTNRYTHAMMWKGGKDWQLEFPDRSQWFLFKEMYEECHNRNIRASSRKNIPIPGVRLIDDSFDDLEEMPYVRNPWYFRQVKNDVEMAMDATHVIYDMDSEDEEWLSRNRAYWEMQQASEDDMITDELFEKVMDMLEKVSYAQKRDHFTSGEIEELIARVSPIQVAKSIYEHWREKRQRKGMPLVRQFQPPLWQRYQQICREWDQLNPKLTAGAVSGSQEKASAGDKPPMFAFCLKPRGLELLNKGLKHRPHKKISLSGYSHAFLGDHDVHRSSGRRLDAYPFGDERAESSDVSPLATRMYLSPRDTGGPGQFSLDGGDASDWNHHPRVQRNNSKNIRTVVSPRMAMVSSTFSKAGKRNNGRKLNTTDSDWYNQPSSPYRHPGQLLLGGSDLDEFRLRDASSAAKHARNMAKLKRERAQKLMLSADLAIHKAVSALMTAEAIKASCTGDNDEQMKSTSPPTS